LPDREIGEDSPVIRNKADTELSNAVRRSPDNVLAPEPDLSGARGVRPIMLLSVVVLPAHFFQEADGFSLSDLEGDPERIWLVP